MASRSWCVLRAFLFLGIVGQLPALPGVAGTIRDDRPDSLYTGLAQDAAYASVGRVTWTEPVGNFLGSGTLIRDDWVLTAAHVVDGTNNLGAGITNLQFLVGGNLYSAADWIPHPTWATSGGENNLFAGWDIGLIRLSDEVSNVAPAELYQATDGFELGQTATIVGYGATGTGLTGATQSAGTRRAGNNVVDVVGGQQTMGSNPNFRFGHDRLLAIDFDEPGVPGTSTLGSAVPLNLEYLTAPGDSGGGLFLETPDGPRVAGVTSLGSTIDGNVDSDYGDRASFTRVASFIDWINDTISANSPLNLLGDYNDDGIVDAADYTVWRDSLGATELTPFSGADGDGDGAVTRSDFNVWRNNFGATDGNLAQLGIASVAVPEPSSFALALPALWIGLLRWRKRRLKPRLLR